MRIIFSSDRNHPCAVIVNGEICDSKTINYISKTSMYIEQYDIKEVGELKISIVELINSRIFRLIANIFVVVLGGLSGGIGLAEFKSVRYTKSKLQIRAVSENVNDEIRIHQVMSKEPFVIKKVSEGCGYEVLLNGRFKGSALKQIKSLTSKTNATKANER